MYHHLTREQRYAIYLGIQEKKSISAIAQQIQVNKSTISREVKRNSNRHNRYLWKEAEELSRYRSERRPGNRAIDKNVLKAALSLLKQEQWSPSQISGYLKLNNIFISHETIYRQIRSDESGELKKHCRHKMKYRRHNKVHKKTKVKNIPNRVSIHDRPLEANGKRFGDWEMDLIVGKGNNNYILTLCERATNYMIMKKLHNGKKPDIVANTVIDLLYQYRKNILTITTDNGSEFREHDKIAKALNTKVYFADSFASWQKGAIENTNKLIRQYIPKGVYFQSLTDEFIHSVQLLINKRPRKKLNFLNHRDCFFNLLL